MKKIWLITVWSRRRNKRFTHQWMPHMNQSFVVRLSTDQTDLLHYWSDKLEDCIWPAISFAFWEITAEVHFLTLVSLQSTVYMSLSTNEYRVSSFPQSRLWTMYPGKITGFSHWFWAYFMHLLYLSTRNRFKHGFGPQNPPLNTPMSTIESNFYMLDTITALCMYCMFWKYS